MKNLFENKSDKELKMYFKQFQSWETLGIVTDNELRKIKDIYIKELGDRWRTALIIDLLKTIGFRWLKCI